MWCAQRLFLPSGGAACFAGEMQIGVVADTHDRVPDGLLDGLRNCDEIWHLGDVCRRKTLDPFYHLGPRLLVIRGNNDWEPDWRTEVRRDLIGFEFYLVHIPPRKSAGADVVLHGHTHVPRDEVVDGVRYLNPGAAGLANKGAPRSFAIMNLSDEREIVWNVHRL